MHVRRFFAALISASVAWGGFVLADQPAAYAICSDPCGGGGGYDPTVHAFVDLTVQGLQTTSSVGSVTGGHLAAACTSSCTDSWADTLSTEESTVTYTATPNSGWAIDHWVGCAYDPKSPANCAASPAYTTSFTKTSDNTTAVAVYFRDSTNPTVQITNGPAANSYISQSSSTFSFFADGTGTQAATRCSLDAGNYFGCASPWNTGSVADGQHTFHLLATDGGNNTAEVERSYTVDTKWPTVNITAGPLAGSYVNSSDASFTFTESDANIDHAQCGDTATASTTMPAGSFDCGSYVYGFPIGWSDNLSNLPQGVHTFVLAGYDRAGHFTQISRTWYVDTVAPSATFTGGPEDNSVTANPSPTFDFSLDGTGSPSVAVTCSLAAAEDANAASDFTDQPCTSDGSEALSGLGAGTYTLTLNLKDTAGNTVLVNRTFTVDTSVPALSIVSGPDAGSYLDSNAATFGFTADNTAVSVTCNIDNGPFRACSGSTSDALTNLGDGPHTWTVKAVNAANTATQLARSFTVDTTAPTAAFTSGPEDGSLTNNASPLFAWTADGTGSPVAVTCKVDAAADGPCTSPTTEQLSSLSEGAHTLIVHATDATGHTIDITRTFTVDTTPPSVIFAAGPDNGDAIAASATSYFFSADAGTLFECATDSDAFGACTGTGSDSLTGLADGVHTWHLQATDTAGNVTTVDRSFTVDTALPTAAFISGVADNGFTNDTTPQLDFAVDGTGTDASSTCSVDSAAAAPCTSATSYVMPVLAQGTHTAHVTVTDAAGNVATIDRAFTVDTTAPTLMVLSGLANNSATNQTTVTFGFSAENGTSVGCSLDSGDYVVCTGTGGDTTTGLTAGKHTWSVRATDPAGNHTVVSRAFTVDLTKPSITSTTSWPMFSLGKTLTYSWTPTDAGSGIRSSDVQVRHAGPNSSGYTSWSAASGWTATTARKVSLNATRGYTYCFHVRTRDKAGNTSGWSAAHCTTLPIDDVSLKRSTGWKKVTGTSFYAHTATQTTRHNATLTSGTVHARHVSIVVTTCKGCGMVGVYRGSTLLKKISLAATKTHHQVILTAWSGSSARTGAIRIKVLSASGHLVQIDGLAVTLR